MDKNAQSGSKEVPHIADWSLEVWSSTLEQLFETACRGMLNMEGVRIKQDAHTIKEFVVKASNRSGLLVGFLNEVLFLCEHDQLAPEIYELSLVRRALAARLQCLPVLEISREIKAATYHNLEIRKQAGLYRATLVFDV